MWKQIEKAPKYEVNKEGAIRNIRTQYIVKPRINKTGYYDVRLHLGPERHKNITCLIHQEVAKAFIPNPNNLPCVNHKDGNKLNNNVDNLEWCTYSENLKHAWDNKLKVETHKSRNAGEASGNAKLTNEIVQYVREVYKPYDREFSAGALAKKFGIDPSVMLKIIKKERWKHLP